METPFIAAEREVLLAYLQRQRDLVAWKLSGLDDERARGVATASGLRIHGIVRHLTDVERSWLRRWFDGQQGLPVEGKTPGWVGGLDARPDDRLADSLADYVEETGQCDEVVRSRDLDDVAVHGPWEPALGASPSDRGDRTAPGTPRRALRDG